MHLWGADAPQIFHSEVGATADGWTNTEITEAMPGRAGATGLVHGPYGNDVTDVEIDIEVPAGVTRCEITWKSWSIDSRDNEADRLIIRDSESDRLLSQYLPSALALPAHRVYLFFSCIHN